MSQAPAGWYPQPDGTQRYWDGSAWTEHISGTPSAPATPPPPPADAAPAVPAPEPAPAKPAKAKPAQAEPASPAIEDAAPVVIASSDTAYTDSAIARPAVASNTYSAVTVDARQKKSKLVPILLAVFGGIFLLVIIFIAVVFFFVKGATKGPEDAASALFAAWKAKDCRAEFALTDPIYVTTVDEFCESTTYAWVDDMHDWKISITGTSITNDNAVVTTKETYTWADETSPSNETWLYYFVHKDGKWYYTSSEQES